MTVLAQSPGGGGGSSLPDGTGFTGYGIGWSGSAWDVRALNRFSSSIADGAASVAYSFDTTTGYVTTGATLLEVKNNGVAKLTVDKDGNLKATSSSSYWRGANNQGIRDVSSNNLVLDVTAGAWTFGNARVGFAGNTSYSSTAVTSDTAARTTYFIGSAARTTATVNIVGGSAILQGGDGALSSSGAAHGGNVYVRGGQQYGTGHAGYVILDNLPTADPGVSGALWIDTAAGRVLKVSA